MKVLPTAARTGGSGLANRITAVGAPDPFLRQQAGRAPPTLPKEINAGQRRSCAPWPRKLPLSEAGLSAGEGPYVGSWVLAPTTCGTHFLITERRIEANLRRRTHPKKPAPTRSTPRGERRAQCPLSAEPPTTKLDPSYRCSTESFTRPTSHSCEP